MKKMKKSIARIVLAAILMLSSFKMPVLGDTPLSLALNLEKGSMKQGDKMRVSVSLQNYDEGYTDNVITTIIVEVSVNTENLQVNKDNITVDLDEGKGMAFSAAQMKDKNNVELQYLNISNPLAKGTKDLYSFEITALKDIENLPGSISISYTAMQDGSKAESKKLTVVPFVMVDGKAMEQETVDEKYTSEYGTMDEKSSEDETVSQVSDGTTSKDKEEEGSTSNQSLAGGKTESKDTEETAKTQSDIYNEEKGETSAEQQSDEEKGNSFADGKTDTEQSEPKKSKAQNADRRNSVAVKIIVTLIIITGAVGGVLFYHRKKKSETHDS